MTRKHAVGHTEWDHWEPQVLRHVVASAILVWNVNFSSSIQMAGVVCTIRAQKSDKLTQMDPLIQNFEPYDINI